MILQDDSARLHESGWVFYSFEVILRIDLHWFILPHATQLCACVCACVLPMWCSWLQYTITAAAPCPLPFEEWAVAECPARMDLFGGWTDTPPICYELGGSVINIAVLVDGQVSC